MQPGNAVAQGPTRARGGDMQSTWHLVPAQCSAVWEHGCACYFGRLMQRVSAGALGSRDSSLKQTEHGKRASGRL